MDRRLIFLVVFLVACLVPTFTVSASHSILGDAQTIDEDGPPAPPPGKRPEGTKAEDLDSLKAELKKGNAGTPAWWSTAHKLLDKLTTDGKLKADDAKTFAGTLDAAAKDRLNALVDARGNADINALRKAANTGSGPAREAAAQEVYNRMQDQNAKLTKELFGSRIERAIRDVTKLLKTGMNPEAAGKYIAAEMMRTISKSKEIPALIEAAEKILAKPSEELKKLGIDEKLVKWFRDDAKVAMKFTEGSKTDVSKVGAETPHTKAFAEEYKKSLGENEEFWRRVAVKNDTTRSKQERDDATAWLNENYFKDEDTKEGVSDFVGRSDRNGNDGAGVEVAKAFARQLPDGNFVWDGKNTNVTLGDKGRNQVGFMGKTNEEIRAYIAAVANQNATDHGPNAGMTPDTGNGFLLSTPDSDAAKADGVRRRFATGDSPKLQDQTEPGWTGTPARMPIRAPHVPPPVPTPTPTPTPTPPGGNPPDSRTPEQIVGQRCNTCHGSNRDAISSNGNALIAINGGNRTPGVSGGIPPMPPSGSLSATELAKLRSYFNPPQAASLNED